MGMSEGGSGRNEDPEELSEINVTPFIDVMLVLLIVFMVAAPLSTVDVPINLPASQATPSERPQDPLWLSVAADGAISLDNTVVETADLGTALDAATRAKHDTIIYLRVDQHYAYGGLMAVLDALRAAGYAKVALVGLEGIASGGRSQ